MTLKRKRIFIITLWLISLVIFYYVIQSAVFKICEKNGISILLDSVKSIPDIVETYSKNEDFIRKEIQSAHEARINGLALTLKDVDDIKSVNEFLKEYKEAGEIEAIAVYDENDNLVYNDGFENNAKADPSDVYTLKAGNRWLVKIKYGYTDKEDDLEYLNSWSRKLSNVIIGDDGYIMAVDKEEDRVLSFSFRTGDTIEKLNMDFEGKSLNYEAFKELFSNANKVFKIKIDGHFMYGTRIEYDDMYLIALIPEIEILYDVRTIVLNLMLVFALITGFAMLFLIFILTDALKEGNSAKLRNLKSKVLMSLSFMLVLIFVLSGWIELLEMSIDKYRDCKNIGDYITSKLEANYDYEAIWENYTDKEYLSKCLMIRSILEATKRPLQINELDTISKGMGIDYISVYDKNGKTVLTNSPFAKEQISKDNYFYPLLMGRDSMVKNPAEDNVYGNIMQYIGASIVDEKGALNGLVLIGMDITELKDMQDKLGFENIIRNGDLSEGTFLALIDKSTGMFTHAAFFENRDDYEEENRYDSFSVEGRNKEQRYDSYTYYLLGEEDINLRESYTNMTIGEVGLDEGVLQPGYSGRQTMKNRNYYAYSQRIGDDICLVMKQESPIEFDNILPVLLSTLIAFFFMLFMLIIFMLPKNALEEEKYASMVAQKRKNTNKEALPKDDYLDMFSEAFDAGKPFFELRWPEDCKAWNDKNAYGKRRSIFHCFILLFVAFIIGQQLFFYSLNDDSIWYYVLSPEWNSGINLITFTKSGIAVIFLMAISVVIHKMLFYVARASDSHVETICHLLDSFIKYACFIAGIFICLSIIGVNMTLEFTVSAGVISVIISIACQSIFADIFSGIFMVFEGVVTAGDFVYFNDRYGAVITVGIRTTQLLWFSEVMVVRNSDFKNYINLPSVNNDRLTVLMCIDFNESLARVERIILKEMKEMHPRFVELTGDKGLVGPEYLGVQKFTDNGVALRFAIYTKGFYFGRVQRAFYRELKMMCERNNIRLAMPQIVVNEPASHTEAPENNYPEQLPRVIYPKCNWDREY